MNLFERVKRVLSLLPAPLRRRIVLMLSLLFAAQVLLWLAVVSASGDYPMLLGLATIAYGFGLRHAVDADHIAAIDNTTRKLMQEGKYPVGVGFFFSLGHSTIVIVLSVLVAISASYVSANLPAFEATGSLIGMTVSCVFLLAIGVINLVALLGILKAWREWVVDNRPIDEEALSFHLDNRGLLARILRPVLKLVDESWQLYFVGLLFGLGFDTATEVGLLSLSAASASSSMPLWCILLLPLAFTAAMTLIDALNGVLMLGAYGWAYVQPVRKLYYNLTVTVISVVTALFIGGIEALQLLGSRIDASWAIFDWAARVQLGQMGFILIGIFLASWLTSVAYCKWKGYELLQASSEQ